MKESLNQDPKTFSDCAYIAVAKHFNKFLKHEKGVLADKDPEELHQMRVGMRRLRSAIVGFAPALNLPRNASEKQVGKIARVLGSLRDIDVLEDVLENHYQPTLPQKEKPLLERGLEALKQQRKKAFKEVQKTLQGDAYLNLKKAFQEWLNKPIYQPIGGISIRDILPDLLLPQVSQLLLHPGWVVGIEFSEGETQFPDGLSPKKVKILLDEQGVILHDLRKEAKRSRYNMELFTQFYGDTYQEYLQEIKTIQSVVGEIQDSFVLKEFLTSVFEDNLEKEMPVLSSNLQETRYQKWQEWEKLQHNFLNAKTRKEFHNTVLQPLKTPAKID